MFSDFPQNPSDVLSWQWQDYQRYLDELLAIDLTPDNVDEWIDGWSKLSRAVMETYNRRYVANSVNTADKDAEAALNDFLENIFPRAIEAEHALKQKLLDSGIEPDNFAVPMRNFRAEAELYREENVPLMMEDEKLQMEYGRITGAQTVEWQGKEVTVTQLHPVLQEQDRATREQAWRLGSQRQLADRAALNDLWGRFYRLREQIARNAGKPDFRAYQWQKMLRFDYTPADAEQFHRAIEQVVVPAASRIYERRRQQMGLDRLRPWDIDADPLGRAPLRPFTDVAELIPGTAAIFHKVDPALGAHFDTMVQEGLLDLDNRKNKAPGGYCTEFNMARRPFIFANAVGVHDDVQTLLHEGGHAFHVFETAPIARIQSLTVPNEFAEVASMSMEYLGGPYLTGPDGGFYTPQDAARARIEHITGSILFWPYMAVVDAFQHWAYTHPEGVDPAACDAQWNALWDRFMPGIDWTGLEDVKVTGWHRKLHIFMAPFYYVEYGLAQLGAVQVWLNSQRDPAKAVQDYRRALALGGTVTLPEMFAAAGARFAFDADTLGTAVEAMEKTIAELETV